MTDSPPRANVGIAVDSGPGPRSAVPDLGHVLTEFLAVARRRSGADRGVVLVEGADLIVVSATAAGTEHQTRVVHGGQAELAEVAPFVSTAMLDEVRGSGASVIRRRAEHDDHLATGAGDDLGGSAVCVPMMYADSLVALLYLEHTTSTEVFTPDRVELLELLGAQVATSAVTVKRAAALQHAHDSLQGEQTRLDALVSAIHHALLIVDETHTVTYSNDAAVESYGVQVGQTCWRTWQGRTESCDDCPTRRSFEDGRPHSAVYSIPGPNEVVRHLECTSSPILDDAGRVTACLESVIDITERRENEVALQRAARLEALGHLAGGVAHDFNNLLMVINMRAGEAVKSLPDADPIREELDIIHQAGQIATRLTRQLLLFSAAPMARAELVDISEVIADFTKMLGRLIGEDIELRLDLAPDLGRVMVDPSQIEQVVVNLAVNAREAMPGGGVLTIQTQYAELADVPPTEWKARGSGSWVKLTVADTGTGMSAEVQDRLFEPFFTTKQDGHGTGLGLATTYGIVRQYGGAIRVDSAPGNGTTFEVFLPVDDAPAAADVSPRRSPRHADGGVVLLVEDDRGVRRVVERVLTQAGYRTVVAKGPGEALLHFEEHEGDVDLLLTDIVMPQLDGVSLANRLRARRPDLRVLYMSGYAGDRLEELGGVPPDAGFLAKPFEVESLVDAVRAALHPDDPQATTEDGAAADV